MFLLISSNKTMNSRFGTRIGVKLVSNQRQWPIERASFSRSCENLKNCVIFPTQRFVILVKSALSLAPWRLVSVSLSDESTILIVRIVNLSFDPMFLFIHSKQVASRLSFFRLLFSKINSSWIYTYIQPSKKLLIESKIGVSF